MHSSNPEVNTGINPFKVMSWRSLIVNPDNTTCGNCGADAPQKANVCVNAECGVAWLFIAASYKITGETASEMGFRLWTIRPGFMFIGIVGGSHLSEYYLAEACFIGARLSWRQTLRRLWLDLLRKDETR